MGDDGSNVRRRALLRKLPAIDGLKRRTGKPGKLLAEPLLTRLCREVVESTRAAVMAGDLADEPALQRHVDQALSVRMSMVQGPALRRLLNGTGVIIHTNAGRAPLPTASIAALTETARGYCNLELSLETGKRGSRQALLTPMLRWLCGAQDALVVNNCAAAVMLALHTIARARPVVVSRGELVEIGGSFRVPDVMSAAGAQLVEVGTTNRTHLRDYRQAIESMREAGTPVAAMMQIHRSNFEIKGFTATPSLEELAELAREMDLPLIVDLGSGALEPLDVYGLRREPTVSETIAAGADVVAFSGDKLLGGPQAGVLAGSNRWISAMSSNPMARAVRIDSMVVATLEPVLRSHLQGRAAQDLPIYRAVAMDNDALDAFGQELASGLRQRLGEQRWSVEVLPSKARMGGGSQPQAELSSRCLRLQLEGVESHDLERRLRRGQRPLIVRSRGDYISLDLRSLLAGSAPEELLEELAQALLDASD